MTTSFPPSEFSPEEPELSWLAGACVAGNQREGAPLQPFLRALLKVIVRGRERRICIVLPDRGATAAELAALVALARARAGLPERLALYASATFAEGELVRVLPSGAVYEYGGYFPGAYSGHVKLRVIGSQSGEARACPVEDVLRLQRTTSPRPKGRLGTDLGVPEPTPFDEVVGAATLGNSSLLKTETLLLAERSTFEEVCANRAISGYTLKSALPWGTIADDGSLKMLAGFGDGAPVCAVASSLQRLSAAAQRLGVDDAIVLIDGARRASNTDALERIAERQRIVLIASAWEREQIGHLEDSGFLVWQPDIESLGGGGNDEVGVGGAVIRSYRRASRISVHAHSVTSGELRTAYEQLTGLRQKQSADPDESLAAALDECFRVMSQLSSWIWFADQVEADAAMGRISRITEMALTQDPFWERQTQEAVDAILRSLAGFVRVGAAEGPPKRNELLNLVRAAGGASASIVVALPAQAERIRARLQAALGVRVLCGWAGVPACEADLLVLGSWPRSERMERLLWNAAADQVLLLAYSHEAEWLKFSGDRHARTRQRWRLRSEEMRGALGLDPMDEPLWARGGTAGEGSQPHPEWQPTRGAERPAASILSQAGATTEALEMRFQGGGYAFITANRSLPRLSGWDSASSESCFVEQVHVHDVGPGDLLVFREAGDTEVIAMIAEQLIGPEYNRLRSQADSWRSVLRSLGSDVPLVTRRLRRFGLDRDEATVHGWMYDDSRIGPQYVDDLVFIGSAARNAELITNAATVFDAIRQVRGIHAAAGARLTEALLDEIPTRVDALGAGPTRIDLTFGAAWLVSVKEVDHAMQMRAAADVNRLLWRQHG